MAIEIYHQINVRSLSDLDRADLFSDGTRLLHAVTCSYV